MTKNPNVQACVVPVLTRLAAETLVKTRIFGTATLWELSNAKKTVYDFAPVTRMPGDYRIIRGASQ